jgi:uncharacterized protein
MAMSQRGTARAACVLALLWLGAGGCSRDSSSGQQLRDAAEAGDTATCARLVQSGVPVDAAGKHGYTPLGYAVESQRLETVRKLLELGADVNHVDDRLGSTPLIYTVARFGGGGHSRASMGTRNQIARLLLDRGADPNRATKNGTTALHFAAIDKNPELVRMLLAAGADRTLRTAQGHTPLDTAKFPVPAPNDEVIKALEGKL